MAVRLRRAPPRRRRGSRPTPVFGLVAVAFVLAAFAARAQLRAAPTLRIERLPAIAAEAPAAGSEEAIREVVSPPPLLPPPPYLAGHRIVSFYGNPLAEVLGVLGQQSPEETVARLRVQADAYRALSTDKPVVPALHLIYAVAQSYPGEDGSYLLRMDDALVESYITLARENGMLLFLDIQLGRSTVELELPHIFKYLLNEHVHVALDPEFAWGPHGRPGDDIGHLDASQIDRAQMMLQRFSEQHALPSKMLIVHQFLSGMVRNKSQLRSYDRVELVFDADGFGARAVKLDQWERVIKADNVQVAGIKLFYKHDPDLMSPTDVLNLDPKPSIIIYQ